MAAERKLTVVLAGDARGMTTALGKAETATGRFGSKIGGLSNKAKAAFAGLGVAALAFAKTSVDAYVEAEEAQTRLSDAFEKFPALAGGNIEALRDLNTALAQKTRFDDDATASGQAVLAQFKLTQDQLTQLTPLLQDYAAKTGKDLPTAAGDLGKAILGQGRALKAIGVDFKDTGSAAGNFEQLMGALNQQVGGFAEKQGKTASGQAEILRNRFGELQEKVGSVLVPALLKLTTFLETEVVPKLRDVKDWLDRNEGAAQALAIIVGGGLTAAMVSYTAAAGSAAVATIVATLPFWLFVAAVAALTLGTQWLIDKFDLMPKASRVINTAIRGITTTVGFLVDALSDAVGLLDRLQTPLGGNLLSDQDIVRIAKEREGRAMGGPVRAGQSYIVGERGPEMFTPATSGAIIPNHALGGGDTYNVYVTPQHEGMAQATVRELRRFSVLAGN